MEKYRKQRNKILLGGILVTVTLGTCIGILKKRSDEKINDLEKKATEHQKKLKIVQNKYEKAKSNLDSERKKTSELEKDIAIMKEKDAQKRAKMQLNKQKDKVTDKVSEFTSTIHGATKIASAQTEVFGNAAKDCVNQVKDAVKIIHEETNTINKANAVANTVGNIAGVGKSVVNGDAMNKNLKNKIVESKGELIKLNKRIENAKKVLSTSEKGSERYNRAKAFLEKAPKVLEKKQRSYTVMVQQLEGTRKNK